MMITDPADSAIAGKFIHQISADTITAEKPLEHKKWTSSHYFKQSIVPVSMAGVSLSIMAIPDLKERIQQYINWDHENKVPLFDDQ
ncbi:MAG: hypothetical protein Q8914_12635, partial [Bacteroidota bacterium]|nr:hypothetical protein [Bacteroidota bacterium]